MSSKLEGTDEELSRLFYTLTTTRDVAKLLDVRYDRLIYHLHKTDPTTRYTTFHIAKKSGGLREISAPTTALKIIQCKLNQVLQSVCPRKPQVHGFVYGKGILSNANEHSGKRLILRIDLKNFFPSINFGRVRGMFMARPYYRNPAVATLLAQICCFDNKLPQGAPTSPVVSNMVSTKMDSELLRLAEHLRCTFTRYADDLTFSIRRRTFPSQLCTFNGTTKEIILGTELYRIIESNNFEINPKKTRILPYFQRQVVTGLITNKKPNVSRKFVNQIRAMIYAWEKYGLIHAQLHHYENYDNKHRSPTTKIPSFSDIVQGKIQFLKYIKGNSDKTYIGFRNKLQPLISDPGKVRNSNLYWFTKKDLDRYQLTLDFEETLGIRLLPDTESLEADGYLQIYKNIVTVELCTEDKPINGTPTRRLRERLLSPDEEHALRKTYEAHKPKTPTYQGEMAQIVTRYSPSVGRIVVTTSEGIQRSATGYLINRRNLLMTAAHVVYKKPTLNFVEFEKVQVRCRILLLDEALDVAILQLEEEVEAWPLKIKRSLEMPQDRGMRCVTIGYPEEPGYFPRSVATELSITGITGNYILQQEIMTLSEPLGSGTSGSPIINKNRSLVGMVVGFGSTVPLEDANSPSQENQKWPAGAVSCNQLLRIINQIEQKS